MYLCNMTACILHSSYHLSILSFTLIPLISHLKGFDFSLFYSIHDFMLLRLESWPFTEYQQNTQLLSRFALCPITKWHLTLLNIVFFFQISTVYSCVFLWTIGCWTHVSNLLFMRSQQNIKKNSILYMQRTLILNVKIMNLLQQHFPTFLILAIILICCLVGLSKSVSGWGN